MHIVQLGDIPDYEFGPVPVPRSVRSRFGNCHRRKIDSRGDYPLPGHIAREYPQAATQFQNAPGSFVGNQFDNLRWDGKSPQGVNGRRYAESKSALVLGGMLPACFLVSVMVKSI